MQGRERTRKLPYPFVMRRLHSLLGLWLAVYLFEHLLVNSQAALYFQDDGSSFIRMVNKIHATPFLKVVEILFLGLPFLIHGLWGIRYAITSKCNSFSTSGTTPALPQYRKNRAFTWQRITSWILLVFIIGHVVQMRFIYYPTLLHDGEAKHYLVRLRDDPGLNLVVAKLHAKSFTEQEIVEEEQSLEVKKEALQKTAHEDDYYVKLNQYQEGLDWLTAAKKKPLKAGEVLIDTPNAGSAFFLIVRETFKSPLWVILYTIFVLAACYHGYNGLWTFMITWGVTLTRLSQNRLKVLTSILMTVVTIFGLMAVWGPYWTFQFQG